MIDGIAWFFGNLVMAIPNLFTALINPAAWLDWSDPQAVFRFIYYGASVELFFVALLAFLILTAVGVWKKDFLWGVVRGLEGFANVTGRFFAWAGLIMVLQQVVIVFVQRIFARVDLSFGLGTAATYDISWWAEELKLYNAMVVCLCCAYTFVQKGHVRVDLVYASVSYRTKRLIDMIGCLIFMIPSMLVMWFYVWFFLWRHLITPKVSATDPLERLILKAQAFRWNVETIGFSPNGFSAYFLFKILMVCFCFMMLLQAVAFFYRSYLEYVGGEEAEDKFLDRDTLDDPEAAVMASGHQGEAV